MKPIKFMAAIDIGNTNISLGIFRGGHLVKAGDIPTKSALYSAGLKKILGAYRIEAALICSVVPGATAVIAGGIKKICGQKPYIIGKDFKVPIINKYLNPRQVGQDRLVNAYAATRFYGAPAIVVDYGTAITLDVISGDREYLGGVILPGLELSLRALAENTALLPKVSIFAPSGVIGRDTKKSMVNGIVLGSAAATGDLIAKIKKIIGDCVVVVATGGNCRLMKKYCGKIQYLDPALTLRGINLVYRKNFS